MVAAAIGRVVRRTLVLAVVLIGASGAAAHATTVNPDLELACSASDGGITGWDGCNLALLAISDEPQPASAPVRALVKFDIADLGLPSNTVITGATLSFTTSAFEGDRYEIGGGLRARSVFASWNSSVSYDLRDGTNAWSPGDFGSAISPSAAGPFGVDFDVTDVVQDIVDGTQADNGFSVSGPTANSIEHYLAEGYGSILEPRLELTY